MAWMHAVESVSRKTFSLGPVLIPPFVSEKTAFEMDSWPWGPYCFFFDLYMRRIVAGSCFEFTTMLNGSPIREIFAPLQLKLTQVAIKMARIS
jgi:hypothetical protein